MTNRRSTSRRAERSGPASLAAQLAALQRMTVGELAEIYRETFGEPTRSRNKRYLLRKLAWRIQEVAEGGLSDASVARIHELALQARAERRPPSLPDLPALEPSPGRKRAPGTERDPRLPPADSVLEREYRGVLHRITVLDSGFEYEGSPYRSLSKIARLIAGTPWNGFAFFADALRGAREAQQ